jgi:hypothetical protein
MAIFKNCMRANCLIVLLYALQIYTFPVRLFGQPQAISVDYLYPPILQAGTSREVQIIGLNLQDVELLQINHPGIRAELISDPPLPFDDVPQNRFGNFRIHASEDVPPGIYQAVAIGRYGAANPRPIVITKEQVDLLPTVPTEKATLRRDIIYLGQTIALKKNELHVTPESTPPNSLPIQLIAATRGIDSPALLKLGLKISEQRTIASTRTLGALPARILLEGVPTPAYSTENDLKLEIHDELYRGGQAFPFLITLSESPDPAIWSPSVVMPASAVLASDLPELPIINATKALTSNGEIIEVSAGSEIQFPAGKSFVVKVTASVNDLLECQLISNSIGHPTDYRIIAYHTLKDGELDGMFQVLEDSPAFGSKGVNTGNLDPHAIIPVPEVSAGTVYLLVQNLQTRVDLQDEPARLRIAPPNPRLRCLAHIGPWSNNPTQTRATGAYLQRSGTFPVHVVATRHGGFSGPITLRFEGLPDGVMASDTILHPSQNEITILLTASEEAAAWNGPIRIIATGQHSDISLEQRVAMSTIWQNPSAERGPVQARLCDELWLSVKEETAPITIQPSQEKPLRVKAGEKIVLPLSVVRRLGGEAKAILRAQNLPPKVTIAEWEVAPDATSTEREIVTAADTPPGVYSICFLAEMVWKMPLHPELLARHVEYRDRLIAKLPAYESSPEKPALEAAVAAANERLEALTKETAPRDYSTHFYTGAFTLIVD